MSQSANVTNSASAAAASAQPAAPSAAVTAIASSSSASASTPCTSSVSLISPPPGGLRHCTVSATHHSHDGPIYASILDTVDGIAAIEFIGVDGSVRTLDIKLDMIETSRHVELDYNNGRVDEYRYRTFVLHTDEDDTGAKSWRSCQVERVYRSGNGYKVSYRLRLDTSSTDISLSRFKNKTIKCSRDDFLVGLCDGADGSIPTSEIKSALEDPNSRLDARRGCAVDLVIPMRSPLGLNTSMGVSHIPMHPHVAVWAVSTPTRESETVNRPLALQPLSFPLDGPDASLPSLDSGVDVAQVNANLPLISNDDMNVMMGVQPAAGKPSLDENSPPTEVDGYRIYRKNEYNPPMPYKEREAVIFNDESIYQRRGKTLGDKLESIMSVERSKTPGANLGHGDTIIGFGHADQPFGTHFVGTIGCGAMRTVQETNKTKAIMHCHLKNAYYLTSMNDCANVSLNIVRTMTRWYKQELVTCAIYMDQFIREAIDIDGPFAHQVIVNSYVILFEGALTGLGRDLAEMVPDTYSILIDAATSKFKAILSMASPEFALSVGVARRVASTILPPSRNARSVNDKPHRGVERNNRAPDRPDKRARAPNSPTRSGTGRIPAWVLAALKDPTGKTICGQHALRDSCRASPCKYLHVQVPNNLPRDVNNWIRNNGPIRNRQ